MGKWTLAGTLLLVGLFFVIFGFILNEINVVNPYTGLEQSVFDRIIDWLNPFSGWF